MAMANRTTSHMIACPPPPPCRTRGTRTKTWPKQTLSVDASSHSGVPSALQANIERWIINPIPLHQNVKKITSSTETHKRKQQIHTVVVFASHTQGYGPHPGHPSAHGHQFVDVFSECTNKASVRFGVDFRFCQHIGQKILYAARRRCLLTVGTWTNQQTHSNEKQTLV